MRFWAIRIGFTAALAGWMVLIFFLSSLPDEQASRVGPYDAHAIAKLGSMRGLLAHLFLFGTLASLFQATLWSWTSFTNYSLRLTFTAIVLATLYGVSDEFHQSYVAGRNMSPSDMLVNALGAVAAVAALRLLMKSAIHSYIPSFKLTTSKA
ncbi:MAG: hypothetical protein BZY80_01005 [SAR202 cluster bacterium Io17-Chloro-G2]|nr:MAG: hypothetical protein BZY80_01005 [SAR202 cluster bacterium Io17-Chloro-G2]